VNKKFLYFFYFFIYEQIGIIYITITNTVHKENVLLCLNIDKAVLYENLLLLMLKKQTKSSGINQSTKPYEPIYIFYTDILYLLHNLTLMDINHLFIYTMLTL
jgi:hypothetical protein